jgi:hypothetical protein
MWIIVFIMVVGAGTMIYRAATDHTEPRTVTPKAISLVAPTRPSARNGGLLAALSCYCQIGWAMLSQSSTNARLELVDATQNPGWSPTVSIAAKSAMAARAEII